MLSLRVNIIRIFVKYRNMILSLSVIMLWNIIIVIPILTLIEEEKEKTIYNDLQMELRNPYIQAKRRER